MTAVLAGMLATVGCTLLLAAACVALAPLVGTAGAIALLGLAFLILSAGAILMRLALRRTRVPPVPHPQPDPLVQLVFDLSFNLGRSMTRRKD
jgi:hypothetical protein